MDAYGPPRGYSGRPNGNYGGRNRGRGRGMGGGGGGGGGPRSPRADQHQNTPSYSPEEVYTKRDIFAHFWPGREYIDTDVSTLNDSLKNPFQLAYVFVFPGGNPRWRDQQILFSKSKLDLLPGYHSEKAKAKALMDDGTSTQSDDYEAEDAMNTWELKQAIDYIGADGVSYNGGSRYVSRSSDVQAEDPGSREIDTTGSSEQGHGSQGVRLTEGHNDRPANAQRELAPENEKKPEVPVIDYIPPKHNPIAFFLCLPGNEQNDFAFIGWYSITNIEILLPGNPMTVTMMEIKWHPRYDKSGNWIPGGKDHPRFVENPQLWEHNLNTEWAAIRFEKWEKSHIGTLPHPAIEKLPPEPSWPHGAAPHCHTCTCPLSSHGASPNTKDSPSQAKSRKWALDQLDSGEAKVENWLDDIIGSP